MWDESSLIGRPVEELATPALVVDPEALDRNLQHMAGYFAGRACKLRPHFKSHKCVTLANRQLAAGNASGITCAKLAEAEQLVAGGVREVLIANQVVGAGKAARVAALEPRGRGTGGGGLPRERGGPGRGRGRGRRDHRRAGGGGHRDEALRRPHGRAHGGAGRTASPRRRGCASMAYRDTKAIW